VLSARSALRVLPYQAVFSAPAAAFSIRSCSPMARLAGGAAFGAIDPASRSTLAVPRRGAADYLRG
jgi:hypothetical protein